MRPRDLIGCVVFVATFVVAMEAAQQLKDSTSTLRCAFSELRDRVRDGLSWELYRTHVEEQMESELNLILKGQLT